MRELAFLLIAFACVFGEMSFAKSIALYWARVFCTASLFIISAWASWRVVAALQEDLLGVGDGSGLPWRPQLLNVFIAAVVWGVAYGLAAAALKWIDRNVEPAKKER